MTHKYTWFESSPWRDEDQTFNSLPKLDLDVDEDQITSVSDKTSSSALLARENANLAELSLRAQALQAENLLLHRKVEAQSNYDAMKLKTELNVARARKKALNEQLFEQSMPVLSPKIQFTDTPLDLPEDLELPSVYPESNDQQHSVPQPLSTPVNDIVKRQIELSEMILAQQRRKIFSEFHLRRDSNPRPLD
ncbi:hypothetical protein LOTGIDRAFT_151940 [Lottia gigantea]|uniref:Uncharacterized protein n=1 Tax=Lottia gigantea TaxID=225164 RepID=V4ALS5_LOTGI|nr:hypothetical protein LOTGIDRAFT_151940 [Lottia gigantea]ESP05139.1 hypothetical protein LOTGIDRAFT_151940 [Lottia gigantea]